MAGRPTRCLSAIVLDCLAYRIGCVDPPLELLVSPSGERLRIIWCSSCYEGLVRRWVLSRAHRGDQTRSTGVVRIAF